jgi:mRNA interferase YafQ
MRTNKYLKGFKRDYKHIKKLRCFNEDVFIRTINLLISDKQLPLSQKDHPLIGNWKGFRECHIKPDLLLIYRKPDKETLELVRIGSHSQLGL